ncbi:ketopantoate hydroxymethyltransferase [Trametes versicolor FP-101664 SS1]|uniref:ketopantoate hydroxymethyltransferase n=1 Tax=Trametes versicolor (strain FP-101664) TaxID=717944 RepID=UPI0004621754|nr:ketopantoate hydroxymethyltransferase [Trametes versicolor FP-101664 SS1]EIW53931.1 ketopantoate hydroxymethyltransferase [Trametes versicolor FP-101664 SS1]
MSDRPEEHVLTYSTSSAPPRKKVTLQHLHALRSARTPITVLTAYDFPTGRVCETQGVDVTLVGDSLAQVCLGYDDTTRLTLDEMLHHVRAVARASHTPLLVADMPFGTYLASSEEAIQNAVRLVREGGAEAVKMEGGLEIIETVRRLTSVGIPVMGHIGLLPQRHVMLSGFRAQGRTAEGALDVLQTALALEDAGAFAMVLEAIPHTLGTYISQRLTRAATIGIGAGAGTDGQVLVWDDMVGTWNGGHKAKFVRRFADVGAEATRGVQGYMAAVRERSFPALSESYGMPKAEWARFEQMAGPVRSGEGGADAVEVAGVASEEGR